MPRKAQIDAVAPMTADALAIQAERRIYLVRGQKVMLDYDMADLYAVETRALKQAVRRNPGHFPDNFMFTLTENRDRSIFDNDMR